MQVNFNQYNANTNFGYNLPKYCDLRRTIPTQEFIDAVAQKLRVQDSAAYEKYMQALENFKNKKLDLTALDKLYRPQIEKLPPYEQRRYLSLINDFKPPVHKVMEKKPQTRNVKTPLKNFCNFLTGKSERNKKVTKIVNVPVEHYDLSQIDVSLDGVNFARYGSIFRNDSPAEDFYEIQAKCGIWYPLTIEKFSRECDYFAEKANKKLQSYLSTADGLNELSDKITKGFEKRFKWYSQTLIDTLNK